MAQDLGIHEDVWPLSQLGSNQGAPFVDLESRRRMSLTYAISDKFPLILAKQGRPH